MKNILIMFTLMLLIASCTVTPESSVKNLKVTESEQILELSSDTIIVKEMVIGGYKYIYEVENNKVIASYTPAKKSSILLSTPAEFIVIIVLFFAVGFVIGVVVKD